MTIVLTDDARKRKFMLGLRVEIAKQIVSGSHGPKSYADAIQRVLRNESWDRGEPRMAPSKVEIIHEAKLTPNEAKKSFRTSAGGSRNNEQYNPVSGSLVKETTEIEPKIEGARPDREGTLGMVPQLEIGCGTRLRF